MRAYLLAIITLAFFAISMPTYSTTLIGDTVDAGIFRASDNTRAYGFGLDSPFEVVAGNGDLKQYSSVFTLDVEESGFLIDYSRAGGWAGYFSLFDLDFGTGITGVTVDTNASNWDLDTMLSFDSTSVTLNWVGISYNSDTYFNVMLSEAPSTVPVPAAAWLFGSALLGFFGFSRRKVNA